MNTYNTCKPSTEQDKEEEVVELLPSVNINIPMEETLYSSSRTPPHDFKLPVWDSRTLLKCAETDPNIKNKSTPVSKPCLEDKQCKRKSFSRPVNKELEVVREKRVKRREGLFSFSLRSKEEIDQDFVRVTGVLPQRKMKAKKILKDPEEKQKELKYQKYLKQIFPGNWLSEIYHV